MAIKTIQLKAKPYAWLMGFTAGTGAKVPVVVPADPKHRLQFEEGRRYGELVRDGKVTVSQS